MAMFFNSLLPITDQMVMCGLGISYQAADACGRQPCDPFALTSPAISLDKREYILSNRFGGNPHDMMQLW
ncbi:hypothetical protein BZM26_30735 [Paraburkholderia strydomiana]|nr:hypothetical protein BZM26_30735 [Paraburkholderia strydomiana]